MNRPVGFSVLLFLAVFLLVVSSVKPAFSSDSSTVPNGYLNAVYEEWEISDDETMGVVGLGVHHNFSDCFSLGVGSWMAVKGERGGFITLGVDGNLCLPITERIAFESGVFIGAGGGRGGYTLSGGGLMLRPHAQLTYDTGSFGKLSAGVSYVRFPNGGSIESTQPYISFSLPFYAYMENGWTDGHSESTAQKRERGSRSNSLAAVVRDLHAASGAETVNGVAQRDFTLLGIEWRSYFNDSWYAKLETEGAAGGNSRGYMQILVGGGAEIPVAGNLFVNADASVGGGGGGNVDTGGGLLLDASAGIGYYLASGLFAGLSGAYITAPDGTFEATSLALKLGYRSGGSPANNDNGISRFSEKPSNMRLRLVHQIYYKASDLWRTHQADMNVENIGIQIDGFLDRNWYLTGQGLAAYGGDAGAYMTGLLGLGVRKNIVGKAFVNAEGLVGAAGGGGLATGGGLVWQGNVGLGYDLHPSLSALATVGRIDAFDGDFKADVFGFSLAYNFNSFLLH
ncbi:hypothetical protein [Prosthecochloris sp.]|uniref:hypothetical protein n=1 Tax=Prosthecochloris sp. TaxID=290513 RepID=UPI002579F9D2|nr:hypothetical protein [Prosthecochloris sp.]